MVSELKKTQTMAEENGDEKHKLTSCQLIIYNTLTLQTHKTVTITCFGYFGSTDQDQFTLMRNLFFMIVFKDLRISSLGEREEKAVAV